MGRPIQIGKAAGRQPFFGEWSPVIASLLVLVGGFAAVITFYVSVIAAAHVITADNGGGREQLKIVTLWMCGLFLLQGLVPLIRFGVNDLPRLMVGGTQLRVQDIAIFLVLLIAGGWLVFG
jgi:hypothetical protein